MLDQATWYVSEVPTHQQPVGSVQPSTRPDAPATPKPRPTDQLLMRIIELQERQLYWSRLTAIIAFAAFVLVFIFGVTIRFR